MWQTVLNLSLSKSWSGELISKWELAESILAYLKLLASMTVSLRHAGLSQIATLLCVYITAAMKTLLLNATRTKDLTPPTYDVSTQCIGNNEM